jgi:hypothetical protein
VQKTVKKLKSKKLYYGKVRTYKNVKINGKTTKLYSGMVILQKVKQNSRNMKLKYCIIMK